MSHPYNLKSLTKSKRTHNWGVFADVCDERTTTKLFWGLKREGNTMCWESSSMYSYVPWGAAFHPFILLKSLFSHISLSEFAELPPTTPLTHKAQTCRGTRSCFTFSVLTCELALAVSLGTALFLKGMPTFHPFVCGWKEKRRKSVWNDGDQKVWKLQADRMWH